MALSLTACGKNDAGNKKNDAADNTQTEGTENSDAEEGADTEEGAEGGSITNSDTNVLYINLASEPDYLDPALNSSVDGGCLAVNTFAGLYTYDTFLPQAVRLNAIHATSNTDTSFFFILFPPI